MGGSSKCGEGRCEPEKRGRNPVILYKQPTNPAIRRNPELPLTQPLIKEEEEPEEEELEEEKEAQDEDEKED